ncbi:hypothetical protein BU17DRAFT_44948 [Hysterangium stoloniferum]|nr:hypothetical protein BU17DRAFT_44948 [Hysterangium stoloniferum]
MSQSYPNAVAVFCGSNSGDEPAYIHAAKSLGVAIGKSGIDFVYGGGGKGLMGVSAGAALEVGAKVLGVRPYAMIEDGKAIDHASGSSVFLNEDGREKVETIVVNSMHERKVEMAKRVRGFFGLPGGFGTFEELLEMTTWTQLEIHEKPVIILNAMGFYNPLRDLIQAGVRGGFIRPENEGIVIFIDGPSDLHEHGTYDWGTAAMDVLLSWKKPRDLFPRGFNWKKQLGGKPQDALQAT